MSENNGPMSSEQLDRFTTEGDPGPEPEKLDIDKITTEEQTGSEQDSEANLATEALEATKDSDDDQTPAGTKPAETVEELQQQITALQQEAAIELSRVTALRAQKRLLTQNVQTSQPGAVVQQTHEKTPLEKFVEENPDDVVPGRIMLEENRFQAKRAAEREAQRAELEKQSSQSMPVEQALESARTTITDVTHGVGLETLSNLGAHLLTNGDRILIMEGGANAGQVTYDRLLARINERGGAVAKAVNKLLKKTTTQTTTNTNPNPNPKPKQAAVNNQGGAGNAEVEVRASTRILSDSIFGRD